MIAEWGGKSITKNYKVRVMSGGFLNLSCLTLSPTGYWWEPYSRAKNYELKVRKHKNQPPRYEVGWIALLADLGFEAFTVFLVISDHSLHQFESIGFTIHEPRRIHYLERVDHSDVVFN